MLPKERDKSHRELVKGSPRREYSRTKHEAPRPKKKKKTKSFKKRAAYKIWDVLEEIFD